MLSIREKFIMLVDGDYEVPSNAIILLEGDGFNRYQHAVDLYKRQLAPKLVFSGDITNYEYGSFPFKDIKGKLINAGVNEVDIIHEDKSKHTKEQAEAVFNLSIQRNWKKLLLVASHEHQYRAFLTFLKVLLNNNSDLILLNSPARNLTWFEQSDWGIRYERLEQEFARIIEYSELGHLATYQQAIDYQKWKEEQIFKK